MQLWIKCDSLNAADANGPVHIPANHTYDKCETIRVRLDEAIFDQSNACS